MIKENKVCISFEDIYAEFPLHVIFASALAIFQANLKQKIKLQKKKEQGKLCTEDCFDSGANAVALDLILR